MQPQFQRSVQVLLFMFAGLSASDAEGGPPPTRAEREKAEQRRSSAQAAFDIKKNLDKSIQALAEALTLLQKDIAGKDRTDPLCVEAEKIQNTYNELLAIQARGKADVEQKLTKSLEHYFKIADPKMIAELSGIEWDGVEFVGTSKYRDRTGDRPGRGQHYALGAEPTWDDEYYWQDGKGDWQWIKLKAITQHEQITTDIIHRTARRLLRKVIAGIEPEVGRVGIMINERSLYSHPDAYKHIFGNINWPPDVVNDSTGGHSFLQRKGVFRDVMNKITRGEGTRTFPGAGYEVTYGLSQIGYLPVCIAAGNDGRYGYSEFGMGNHFFPYRLNIGAASVPSLKNEVRRRDDNALAEIDPYSQGFADAVMQRPQWDRDGNPIKTQRLNPEYKEILAENLWRVCGAVTGRGYKGAPSVEELKDKTAYPPALVEEMNEKIKILCEHVMTEEGTDNQGMVVNLSGTSFASPVAAGVILAARTLFPDASEAEIISAFLSSCQPILQRQLSEDSPEVKEPVLYLTDEKTGYRFAPRDAGHGEFVLKEHGFDSWENMQIELLRMKKERSKLTYDDGRAITSVWVGKGEERRLVPRDGKPPHETLELNDFKDETTDAMKKQNTELREAVMSAFKEAEHATAFSFLKDWHRINECLENHAYLDALDWLKVEHEYQMKQEIKGNTYDLDVDNTRWQSVHKAAEAVRKTELDSRYSYSVIVPRDRDLCITIPALRTKAPEEDRFVVLENPAGLKVPTIMSSSFGYQQIGSTTGFMNQPAAGTWKIHTSKALDLSISKERDLSTGKEVDVPNSSLVIGGTQRDPKLNLIDVRETVLREMEKEDAVKRTTLPPENKLTITDPHALLREWNMLLAKAKEAPKTPKTNTPSRETQRAYMHRFLDTFTTQLKREWQRQGNLKPHDSNKQEDEKVSMFGAGTNIGALVSVAWHLSELYANAHGMPASDLQDQTKYLAENWGMLALLAAEGKIPSNPSFSHLPTTSRDFINPDMPRWQQEEMKGRMRDARNTNNRC